MKGILIYKVSQQELNDTHYETHRFLEEADKMGISLTVCSPNQFEIVVSEERNSSIFLNGQPLELPDFVLHRIGAGTKYFAMALLRQFERLGVPCFNTSEGIESVKDKMFSQQILGHSRLPVPKTMLMKFPVDVNLIHREFSFPLVIKTLSGSLGKGVFMVETKKQLEDLTRMMEIANPNMNVIVQDMVKDSKGRDLRVFVVGGKIIGCMMRKSSTDDFRANFSAGGTVEAFPLNPSIEWISLEAVKVLGLHIAGVDLLFDGDSYKICEVNASPMFKGLESCIDVNVPRTILEYISTVNGAISYEN